MAASPALLVAEKGPRAWEKFKLNHRKTFEFSNKGSAFDFDPAVPKTATGRDIPEFDEVSTVPPIWPVCSGAIFDPSCAIRIQISHSYCQTKSDDLQRQSSISCEPSSPSKIVGAWRLFVLSPIPVRYWGRWKSRSSQPRCILCTVNPQISPLGRNLIFCTGAYSRGSLKIFLVVKNFLGSLGGPKHDSLVELQFTLFTILFS